MDRFRRHFVLVACVCLAAASLAVYSRAVRNPFLHVDDHNYVTENPQVQAGITWQTFTWALTTAAAENWHPLTWLSHALDCQLYGLNPAGHHATNILLHALNVVLLFLLLLRATGAKGRSLLVAALFALHPINVDGSRGMRQGRRQVVVICRLVFSCRSWEKYQRLAQRISRH